MAHRVTHARHAELGLTDDDVLAMYRADAAGTRAWTSGCGSCSEPARSPSSSPARATRERRSATTWPMRRGQDWMAPYYRSIASAITFGMSAEDIITAHLAKGDDVSSGGRQMPGHYGGAPYNIVSLVLAGGDPGPARGGDRDGRLGPRRRHRRR